MVVDQSKRPTVTVKAVAEAAAAEQPVTGLRLFLDGRPFPDPKTSAAFGKGKPKVEVEWTVVLPDGAKELRVQARGPDVASVTEPEAIEARPSPSDKAAVLHVLAVGINDYNDKALKLDLAATDARALAQAFPRHCKSLFREVVATTLIDKQADRKSILAQIEEVRKRAQASDLFVFTFAGHGARSEDQFYLLTVEANLFKLGDTALSGDELRKAVGEFPCQVLLMLDACHSAGFGEGRKLAQAGLRPATDDATRALTEDDVGVAVMCAAMGHEKAIETKGHGLFTQAVLDALAGGPKVPRHAFNNKIYVHHLHSYVFDQVSGISEDRQHPLLNLPWIVESFPLR
jgi:uncharacterized caspase-like protein